MKSLIRKTVKSLNHKIKRRYFQNQTHGELIKQLLEQDTEKHENAVFVETGCGVSTIAMAEYGRKVGAIIYSCDYNTEKIDELKAATGDAISNVNFLVGDSLKSLDEICRKHENIRFLFLDSAASAMHTFREFSLVENHLHPGSQVLIDNAALPAQKTVLSPVRKGKVLVPYLLASPFWEVHGYPRAGDSMVSAVMHDESNYADTSYEDQEYIDNWRAQFDKKLDL